MNTLRQLQETWVYDIINVLATALKPKDSIHALWLEGSYAQGVHDDMSDIDIWVSVDDDKMTEALDVIRTELKNIGELDIDYEMPHLHPKIRHQVFHIKGHSKFHAMDVNVQCLSRIVFLQESVDDYITIFDKSGIIKSKQDDPEKDSQLVDAELAMQYYKLQASNIKKRLNTKNGLLLKHK